MTNIIEKTLEIQVNIPIFGASDFEDTVMNVFEANPINIRYFGGMLISEPYSDRFSKFYLNVLLSHDQLQYKEVLLDYMKGAGYDCILRDTIK